MDQDPSKLEYIELKFSPRWNYISAARGFLQNFLAISISDQAKADRIAMSASELLENAVKYSVNSETYMNVIVNHENSQVSVKVSNDASPEAIRSLQGVFEKINQGEPLEAYVSQMKEAATRSDGKSQLGLVRIRYEAGAQLFLEVQDGKRIEITAVMN